MLEARKQVQRLAVCCAIVAAVLACSDQHSEGKTSEKRDAQDSLIASIPPTVHPDDVYAADSLGQSLAMTHFLFLSVDSSEKARKLIQGFSRAASREAAALAIELPPRELTGSFDPKATEIIRRISFSKGREVAAMFAISYHGNQALFVAQRLDVIRNVPNFEEDILKLILRIHMNEALSAAKELGLPGKVIAEGEVISAEINRAAESAGDDRQGSSLEASRGRFSEWLSRITTGVPFELTLRSHTR